LAGIDAIEKIKNLRIAEFNESDKSNYSRNLCLSKIAGESSFA
jgi:hypothetical protein